MVPADDPDSPWRQLVAIFEHSPRRLADLIEDHRHNGAELVAAIVTSAQADDLPAIAHSAHALKSSAAQFGSRGVAGIATRLEERASAAFPEDVTRDVDALSQAWPVADERLGQLIQELRSSLPEGA